MKHEAFAHRGFQREQTRVRPNHADGRLEALSFSSAPNTQTTHDPARFAGAVRLGPGGPRGEFRRSAAAATSRNEHAGHGDSGEERGSLRRSFRSPNAAAEFGTGHRAASLKFRDFWVFLGDKSLKREAKSSLIASARGATTLHGHGERAGRRAT